MNVFTDTSIDFIGNRNDFLLLSPALYPAGAVGLALKGLAGRVAANSKIAESALTSGQISEGAEALPAFPGEDPQAGPLTDFSSLTSVSGVNPDIISALRENREPARRQPPASLLNRKRESDFVKNGLDSRFNTARDRVSADFRRRSAEKFFVKQALHIDGREASIGRSAEIEREKA
ncbi:MAG TPA: hypothetical protein VML01_04940 [Bryobacterales bacterium]|nr:hypothetical protein [Bryobacterales bacterium]